MSSSPGERTLVRPSPSPGPVSRSTGALPSNHFAYADGMRVLAILCVVLNHFAGFGRLAPFGHVNDLFFLGRFGVNCFFMLSGFLLSRSFLKAILDPACDFPSVRTYLLRRFNRIYPLYAVAVLVSAFISIFVDGGAILPFVVSHLTFAQGLFVDQVDNWMNGPLWTMVIDAQFYLALPLAAIVARKALAGRSRASRTSALFVALGAISIASLVYRYVAYERAPQGADDFAVALVYVRNFAGMLPAFALGIALSLVALERKTAPNRTAALVIMMLGIGFFAALGLLKSGGSSLIIKVLADTFAALSGAAIFYGIWTADIPQLSRFANSALVAELATLAYGIYLFHWPILTLVSKYLPMPVTAPLYFLVFSISSSILIVPSAYVMHRLVERPFLSINERLRRTAS